MKKKLELWDWLILIDEFSKKIKKQIRDDFKKHIEEVRELTDGFVLEKIYELSKDFKWKHDYYSEWCKFINEKDEDLIDEAKKTICREKMLFH
jgi:hypothetical protein